MPTLHIDICEHAGFVTVSEMRRMIARAVARLNGSNAVSYRLEYNSQPHNAAPFYSLHHDGCSVSQMRRNLARWLASEFNGNNFVTFAFHCKVQVN